MSQTDTKLYLISPDKIDINEFEIKLDKALSAGEVAAFQLRLKDCDQSHIIESGKKIKSICHKYGVQFILNDDPNIAKLIDADGVHLGEEDMSVVDARAILGDKKIIGASCYDSIDRAIEMCEKGVDYVAFGAFFHTTSKKKIRRPKPEILDWWIANSNIPCVAIGGIKAHNCKTILEKKPDFIAVITYVWEHEDGPKAAVENLLFKINEFKIKS